MFTNSYLLYSKRTCLITFSLFVFVSKCRTKVSLEKDTLHLQTKAVAHTKAMIYSEVGFRY
jgi:hypothetical protein